jgi:biopolymer transport protein ExbD
MPAQLESDGAWPGEVRVAKIRVWADDDYRAQNVRWQRGFAEQLDYANAVLAPLAGVRLVAEYRSWPRHAPGSTLDDSLAALAKLDPGDGVLSVVGLTSALGLASATFEQLGLANLPGRYMMLRGYADGAERAAFERAFRDLRPDERAALIEARRRHKTAALLLHELGHNLGAPHEDDPDAIMNSMYSHHAARFSARSRALIVANLDERLGRKSTPLALPAATARHPKLLIGVSASGEAVVGGRPVDDATLDELLRDGVADDRDTELVVKASKAAPYAAVVKLLDRAKAAGIARVTLEAGDDP